VKWRKKSGELIEVLMSMAPITVDGQACLITIATDIGELKRAEQARLEMERQLLHAQKLESLGVLAGGIAHDFNNLLMAILGNLDLALMDLSPVSPARSSIEQSAIAARRAADLTRQMLAYSGRASFDIRQINLSELVAENAHLFRACISKIVVLNVHLDHDLPLVNADSGQIQQVIMNLITNASEAIGDRPGAISLSTGL
jgi:signal transduction histidine kinase